MASNSRFTYIEPKDKFKKINMNVILKYDPVVVGIYSKLVTMSSGKSLSIDFLSKRLKVSKERMRKVIVFLEGEGYITREAIRNDEGRLDGWNYRLYAEPVSEDERTRAGMKAKKDSNSRVKDSPCYGFSDNTEKPEDIIIDNTISNNKIDKNIEIEKKVLSNDNTKKVGVKELSEEERKYQERMREMFPRIMKMDHPLTLEQGKKLKEMFSDDEILQALEEIEDWKPLLTKRVYAFSTIKNWILKNRDRQ